MSSRFALFKRKIPEFKFFKTAVGYETIGLVAYQVYYNLYQDQSGNRKSKRFFGKEVSDKIPGDANFSVAAQVDAWVSGGPEPSDLFYPIPF